jgi:hypothetical protein
VEPKQPTSGGGKYGIDDCVVGKSVGVTFQLVASFIFMVGGFETSL